MKPAFSYESLTRAVEQAAGSAWSLGAAGGVILVWALSGPIFDWSDTWQLVINTGTTIVTFLMVFFIQNTQSRDTKALHLKLDELVRATAAARNEIIVAEELGVDALEALRRESRGDEDA